MGATASFSTTYNLVLTEQDVSRWFLAEVSLGVDEARRLKNTAKGLALVKFEEPYVLGLGSLSKQFQTRLVDVWFFDTQTGKIIAKMSQSAK